jgi:hypothetical protein
MQKFLKDNWIVLLTIFFIILVIDRKLKKMGNGSFPEIEKRITQIEDETSPR